MGTKYLEMFFLKRRANRSFGEKRNFDMKEKIASANHCSPSEQ